MDLLTQGLLGAATAHAGSNHREARFAAFTGFLAGMLPDVDALIRNHEDPLMVLEYHRHFTHSLLFIPVGAVIVSLLLWPFLRKKLSFHKLFLYALLGISLAGLLDACTSYGTHLLWPFSDERIAWGIIAIIDPVFTLLITIPLLFGIRKKKPLFSRLALGLATAYMLIALLQSDRAYTQAQDLIAARGHQAERIVVKPTLANLLLWRSVYLADGIFYVDAVRVGLFQKNRIYPGDSLPALDSHSDAFIPDSSRASTDFKRFARFSDGWVAIHPDQPQLVGDIRYAMLPNSTMPLWGIQFNLDKTDDTPQFITNRKFTQPMRRDFINMLSGNDL